MPLELSAKVWKMKNSKVICIPQPFCEAMDIKDGDVLGLTLSDSTMMVRKKGTA